MKAKLFNLFAVAFLYTAAGYAQTTSSTFTAIAVQPTTAYLQHNGQACRMVRMILHGGASYAPGQVYVSFNGLQDSLRLPADTAGLKEYEIPLPGAPVTHDVQAYIRYATGGRQYHARCIVPPARTDWKVYVMPHSHVDVGYTNVQSKVLAIHMNNIDEAIKIAERSASYPPEARFKWNTEAIWVVEHYLALSDEAKQRRFWDAVKKGWINLDGGYGNINTSATSAAQLLHMFYTGIHLGQTHGIQVNSMFQGDVPGASWGLAAQADITGVHYFLSAPNASDRIGSADLWRDKPFYWQSPSGGQKLLFWQSSPYSIGYRIKGNKIPNFFTVEDPKPYYTGHPSEHFLDPFLFDYLARLEQKGFPYNMTLLTWAMSDNAPIDPELPEAVKAWNERYASPKLVITSVKQFLQDFEKAYKDKIPVIAGDYTEFWTDGIASAARETGINRNASDRLQQAGAIWALRGKPGYPAADFDTAWTNIIMFNEHTWGAYNSVSHPEDPKAISQWKYKQAFALNGAEQANALLAKSEAGEAAAANAVDVYNTLAHARTGLVVVPASLSSAGDLVQDSQGHKVPSQRLGSGELAFVPPMLPPFSKQRFTIQKGAAYVTDKATVKGNTLENGIYTITLDENTGNIIRLLRKGSNVNLADSAGLNQYTYLPGDSAEKVQYAGHARIQVKEKGPLVVSLAVRSDAPGANSLQQEVQLVAGIDNIALTNTIDKKAIGSKESVHFVFPFHVPGAQVRYSIPWGSVMAEADQLPYTNRNWYTLQRWVDVSNKNMGITWSSPDAPLFEIGRYPTAGLIGGLHNSPLWRSFTEQQPVIASWVMNNLWHTNFRRSQEGPATFHYYLQVHHAYDAVAANRYGLASHQPLVAAPATGAATEALFFNLDAKTVYVENISPARNGKGVQLQLVNAAGEPATVTLQPRQHNTTLEVHESNLLEADGRELGATFTVPAKGVMMIHVTTR
ncbi:MAG TPA: glycoside hydrolase family 38 C-terminal domain-containing protein [Chitinophaga sp.]|uniref:glycoside hydrolase family 38 N-terminal domain-containing protein n=1 Tax=Chitinophaga sp. TaxID=1869181 RepID=UPI002DB8BFC7|nr:glycoside hydrolase family 38 C-terminal domain-containing protein [Chitinophaga sp.]HEU4555309.1 glycoside hydrolase family 38 C-terminal domain-containing protein [Chitinophaga sp.]